MSDLSWIIGTIITVALMLGGLQLTLWSFMDAAIRENRAATVALRAELTGDLAGVHTGLKDDLAGVRTELKGDLAGVRTELTDGLAGVHTGLKDDLAGVRTELKGDLAGVRTELTDGLAGVRAEIADLRTDLSDVAQRVASIEGFLEGRAGRRSSLEAPAASRPGSETRNRPDDSTTGR